MAGPRMRARSGHLRGLGSPLPPGIRPRACVDRPQMGLEGVRRDEQVGREFAQRGGRVRPGPGRACTLRAPALTWAAVRGSPEILRIGRGDLIRPSTRLDTAVIIGRFLERTLP